MVNKTHLWKLFDDRHVLKEMCGQLKGEAPPQKNQMGFEKRKITFFCQKGEFSGPSKRQKIVISGPLILQKYLPSFQGP